MSLGPRAGTLDERGRPGRSAKEFAWSAKDFERYHQRLEPFLKSAAADISHVAQDAFAEEHAAITLAWKTFINVWKMVLQKDDPFLVPKNTGGLSAAQKFLLAYARAAKTTEASDLDERAPDFYSLNPRPPSNLLVNAVLTHCDFFQTTYDVKPGDPMSIPLNRGSYW